MTERDQAKDAGYDRRVVEQAPEREGAEAFEGGIFGLPAVMQSMELSGQMGTHPAGHDPQTAQSEDVRTHGGWHEQALEGEGGGFGADDDAPDPEDAPAGDPGSVEGARVAAATDAEARLRAAVNAAQETVRQLADRARAALAEDLERSLAHADAAHRDGVAGLGRATRTHRRPLEGALSLAQRIDDDAREAIRRSTAQSMAAVDAAADRAVDGLDALAALHADRIGRKACLAEESGDEAPGDAVEQALAHALAALRRAVEAARASMDDAVDEAAREHRAAYSRGRGRLDRLVAEVRVMAREGE